MANYALLTAVGRNQPGIVSAVSGVLYESGCNIEDSEMARLGGTFSIMLMLRLPEGLTGRQVKDRLAGVVESFSLWVRLEDMRPEEAEDPKPDALRHMIRVYGADRKGIVHRITEHLADRGGNITNLHTQVVGIEEPRYVMEIETELAPYLDVDRLAGELSAIGQELGVAVSLRPLDTPTL